MPRYTPKSYDQIMSAMVAQLIARTNLSDVGDSAVLKHLLATAAKQDSQLYYQASLILELFSIDTAAGDDLDERAKEIQPGSLTRWPAVKAQGTVIFSRTGIVGTTVIPLGTKVKTADGIVFSTTASGSITPGNTDSAAVPVLADLGGIAGNVEAATVTKFQAKPAGVSSVTNPSKYQYGFDKESDDSFRARLKTYVASLSRCNMSAIEAALLGKTDPVSGGVIQFAHVVEDIVNRANISIYIDDGSGTAETTADTASALTGTWTWNSTTTVTTTDTSGIIDGNWIRCHADPYNQWFQITSHVPNTSVTILNPGSDTIPTGAGADKATDILTASLSGPPPGTAVGGETTLWLDKTAVKRATPIAIVSSISGNLVETTDYVINTATGQVDFIVPLINGEIVIADYTYYTGLIAYAQKIVDGDPADRINYPGYRAAGIFAQVVSPQILIQNIIAAIVVSDGYTASDVIAAVKVAIKNYINTLAISGDVIFSELIAQIMAVPGVYDVILTEPTANVTMLDDQLARTTDANIAVS